MVKKNINLIKSKHKHIFNSNKNLSGVIILTIKELKFINKLVIKMHNKLNNKNNNLMFNVIINSSLTPQVNILS